MEHMMDVEKPASGLSGLTDVLGCVLTYQVLHVPGVHGQTVGADGTGTFAELYLGDPERAAELAMRRIRTWRRAGGNSGPCILCGMVMFTGGVARRCGSCRLTRASMAVIGCFDRAPGEAGGDAKPDFPPGPMKNNCETGGKTVDK